MKNLENKNVIKKNLTETIKLPLFFLISTLIVFFIYTFTNPIPTGYFDLTVGTGAKILDLGDRYFYLTPNSPAGFLYPSILKIVTFITEIFNLGNTSKLWNIITISITSFISVLNLFLIDKACWNIFGSRVAKITNWLYVICPYYTIFYSISGGLTMYLMLGTSLLTYLVSSSSIFKKIKV